VGGLNTVVLLFSSWTMAMCIRNAQKNQQGWLKVNLAITWLCALAFIVIKLTFEYTPKLTGWFFFLDRRCTLPSGDLYASAPRRWRPLPLCRGYGGKARHLLQLPVLDQPVRADLVGRLLRRDRHPRDARRHRHDPDRLALLAASKRNFGPRITRPSRSSASTAHRRPHLDLPVPLLYLIH